MIPSTKPRGRTKPGGTTEDNPAGVTPSPDEAGDSCGAAICMTCQDPFHDMNSENGAKRQKLADVFCRPETTDVNGLRQGQLTGWFQTRFVDDYDWVMPANVVGMSQHADGAEVVAQERDRGDSPP